MKATALVAWNLRLLRVKRALSQEALAVDAGVDRSYVGRIERGMKTRPPKHWIGWLSLWRSPWPNCVSAQAGRKATGNTPKRAQEEMRAGQVHAPNQERLPTVVVLQMV